MCARTDVVIERVHFPPYRTAVLHTWDHAPLHTWIGPNSLQRLPFTAVECGGDGADLVGRECTVTRL